MNAFTALAIFISSWQCSKAMKIQTLQFPRDSYNYSTDCWSVKKKKSFGKMTILAFSVLSSPRCDFQVLFAQFTRQTHCLLFARADVCLIHHLLLPSLGSGKSYCSLYFHFCLHHLPFTSQGTGREKGQWLLLMLIYSTLTENGSICRSLLEFNHSPLYFINGTWQNRKSGR